MSSLMDFKVGDLVYPDSKLIFILESPHDQEIKFGHPAAGDTGLNMSKILFNIDVPIGGLLNKGASLPVSLSIINCSRLPLQRLCYGKFQLSEQFLSFLEIHEFKDSSINNLKYKIKSKLNSPIGIKAVANFQVRLKNCIDVSKDAKLVVCGLIAQCFFEEATSLQLSFRTPKLVTWSGYSFRVYYEYHPSSQSGQWNKSCNMVGLLEYIS